MGFEELLGVNPWTAAFTLANTVTVFIVLSKYLFKPVLKIIADRQQEIDDMYTQAGQDKAQAAQLRTEYEEKLAAAQQTSERMVKEAVARGQSREEEILRQANQEAAAILDKAAADIAQEKKKAINDAKDEISGISMAIAEKVVEHQLNDADQQKLVEQFIENLGGAL